MDIVVKQIFQEVKKTYPKLTKNAIVAGGSVRDYILKGEMKDVDILVPIKGLDQKDIIEKAWAVNSDSFTPIDFKNGLYDKGSKFYKCHLDLLYKGSVNVDIIWTSFPDDLEDYPKYIVSQFDYNINMAWFDGNDVICLPEFEQDHRSMTATLSNLSDISQLEKAMIRFGELKARYPTLKFRTDILEIKSKEKVNNRKEFNLFN